MRLLLDEMWSQTIAAELRRRNHDVVAINDPEQQARYRGTPDDVVFERAQEDGFTIVTDNVADFEAARTDWENAGREHHGVLYALDPPFSRHQPHAVIGQMVRALDSLLGEGAEVRNATRYLRPA